jgi:hypothetical protein
MSKTGLAAFLILILCKGYSQQSSYFVLIQADNNQSFYARIDSRIVNSSAEGYLLIAQLKDSNYALSIGFTKSAYPELRFSILINRKDLDFQLKNMGERGWVLYNQETKDLIMPLKEDTDKRSSPTKGIKEDNAFSRLMAGVVNDSSILYNTFIGADSVNGILGADSIKKEILKKDSVLKPKEIKVDTVTRTGIGKTNSKIKKKPPKQMPIASSSVQKLSENSSSTALQLVYLDNTKQALADTVKMTIPFEETKTAFPDVRDSARTDTIVQKKPEKAVILVNSDCKNFATDIDVDRLRQRILNEKDEDQKIAACKKYFKTKCFSVKQVKILSDLFQSDEWKYKFFSTAYPFVSDSDNFLQLESQLSNDNYINLLKGLVPRP